MEVEGQLVAVDEELHRILFTGEEYTKPGSVISNCALLFGSNEGDCSVCTKPCLHPLASSDLSVFFHNENVIQFDWIDDTACIMVCSEPSVVNDIIKDFFTVVFTEETGIIWYKSKEKVQKQVDDDEYGTKGMAIHVYARSCLTSDIEHREELRKAKMVHNIIKHRKEVKKKLETHVSKNKNKNKNKKLRKKRNMIEKKQKANTESEVVTVAVAEGQK